MVRRHRGLGRDLLFSLSGCLIRTQGINGICTNGAPAPDHDLMRIHFLVIGGTVSGLSCGIALCRAGHNVTILEVEDELDQVSTGVYNPNRAPSDMQGRLEDLGASCMFCPSKSLKNSLALGHGR